MITLELLAAQIREVLVRENSPVSREQVAGLLKSALRDQSFITSQFVNDVGQRKVMYEDPNLGFCIVAHEYHGAKSSGPHDHGPSWAIYGQAAGETLMRDYAPVAPGLVREERSYLMRPGDVHVYNEGVVHSPSRVDSTRLIRIEGMNLAGVVRSECKVVED